MLKEIIYSNLSKRDDNYIPDNRLTFAPSYISDCRRKIFYKKTHIQKSNPPDLHAQIKFRLGDATHDAVRKLFSDLIIEEEIDKEKEYKGLIFKYRVDSIIQRNDKKYIVEIKSTYFSGWKAQEKEAKEEHLYQLLMYMIFENIDRGILIYIGRDNGYIVEYDYFMKQLKSKLDIESKINDLIKLKEMIEKNICPVRDYKAIIVNGEFRQQIQRDKVIYKSDWQCSYCDYRDYCWNGIKENIS